ncbi:MAG: hypothetical protein ABIJ97_06665, partial [Bacteroidota bacterium]
MKHKFTFLRMIIFLSFWIMSSIGAQTYTVNLSLNGVTPIAENGGTIDVEASFTELTNAAADADIVLTITWTGATGDVVGEGDITIPSGTLEGVLIPLTITSVDDSFLEGTESVTATITIVAYSGAGSVNIGTATSFNITDAESITLTGGGVSVVENAGSALLTATVSGGGTVSLSGGGALTLNVAYAGSATNGTDYTNVTSFTIANTAQIGTFNVAAITDFNLEGDETVITTISTAVAGVTFTDDVETVTITDDEIVDLSVSTSPIAENGGTVNFIATVNGNGLVEHSDVTVVMTWATGTADAATDYSGEGNITISVGSPSGLITVTATNDILWEDDETIIGTINSLTKGFIGTATASSTITDDEGLIDPLNTITGVSKLPIFQWDEGQGTPTAYDIEIGTVSGAYTTILSVDNILGGYNDFTVTANDVKYYTKDTDTNFPLADATWYYWRVKYDNGTIDIFSDEFSFKTTEGFTLSLSNPSSGVAVYQYDPILFSWYISQSTGNLKYYLQVYEKLSAPTEAEWYDAETTPAIFAAAYDNLSAITKSVTGLKGNKRYYWRVLAYYNDGTAPASFDRDDRIVKYSAVNYFTTKGGAVEAYPSFPIDLATVYTLTPTFYWYTLEYEADLTYKVIYSTAPDTDVNGILDDGVQVTLSAGTDIFALVLVGLASSTTYYWQVEVTYTTNSEINYSAVEDFKTDAIGVITAYPPTASYPVDRVVEYTTSPTLYWYVAGGATTNLTFQVILEDSSALNTWTDISLTNLTLATTTNLYANATSLIAGHTYR